MGRTDAEKIREIYVRAVDRHQKGELDAAEIAYQQIIESAPNHVGSIHNLGLILYQRGQIDDAIAMYNRALEIAPNYDEAYNNLGVALEEQGHLAEAHDAYQRAVQLKPDYVTALVNLGDVLRKRLQESQAEEKYRQALRLDPQNPLTSFKLGECLWEQRRLREGEQAFRQVIRIAPDFPDTYNRLGRVLADLGRMSDSEAALRQAVRLHPDSARFHCDLASVLGFQGRLDEAEQACRQALRVDPDSALAFWTLCTYRKYDSVDHDDVTRMRAVLEAGEIEESDAAQLHFALGKIYDDCGKFDDAFSRYEDANRIRNESTSYSPRRFADFIARVIEVFDSGFFAQRRDYGMDSETPVFIVGMPRSGSTLIEQIVDCHPDAYGAGELDELRELVDRLAHRAVGDDAFPECARDISQEAAATLARDHLARIRQYVEGDVTRILDKMPSNFLHLGLVALLFPKARIIHCCRDPLDTCLSVFFQNFSGVHEYAYDLYEIGTYYRQYDRLMAHWRSVLPLKLYEIQYEQLVSHLDAKARELIDFLELDWDDSCLRFDRNSRSVTTSSAWQVRQPVYGTSVRRWQNYEKYLGPLKRGLGMGADTDSE